MITKEMVIQVLMNNKLQIEETLSALRQNRDLLDFDAIEALEATIKAVDQLIVKTPWDKLSQDELQAWYELNRGRQIGEQN